MKKLLVLGILGFLFCAPTSFAVEEKTLGQVIAVERNFGAPSLELCRKQFQTYITGYDFGCMVEGIPASDFEEKVGSTEFRASGRACVASLISLKRGFMMKVQPLGNAHPGSFSQTEALKCLEEVYRAEGWGRVELKSVVFTIQQPKEPPSYSQPVCGD